jgi:FAD/FMN-containing dehydrogenase
MAIGHRIVLSSSEISEFAHSLDGHVVTSDDPGYDEARSVFNGMISRRPLVIARVAGAADVVRCIEFAQQHKLPVSIRGGGHNVAGNAVADDGLVIDFTERHSVRVDPSARAAIAEPGATWYDFDQASQGHDLATTGGLISSTGVAGFTLGGGIGWLVRKHGLACDNLVAADVVTADGSVRRASAKDDADLLWALRGGGGNFGVVTSYEFSLHPLQQVLGGVVLHPRDQAPALLRFYRDFVANAPDELTTVFAFMSSPDGHPICGVAACYAGDLADGEKVLQPLSNFGMPIVDQLGPMPYTVLQTMLDEAAPRGMLNYWKADFISAITDDAIDAFVGAANTATSPLSQVHIHHLGGAMAAVAPDATAFANREAPFVYNVIGMWPEPEGDEAGIGWGRAAFESLKPWSYGSAYVNFLGDDGHERVSSAYGANYERLANLKAVYDPGNLFRLNQNIVPAR